jgi:glycosyltransferase involved in cell wall biosynthesis
MSTEAGAGPRISVIVAAWNAEATIGAAVASVLEQRDVELECIVVDDGSSDGTAAVVEALATVDDRLVFLRQVANAGVSAARNRALDTARGAWIAFLDADDRLLPGGLGAMVRAGDRLGALAVVGQRISTDGERTWYPRLYDLPDIRRAGRKSIAANPDLLYYAGPAGKAFARELADGLRFEGRVLGDQPWVLRALVRARDRIEVVEDVVYEWRRPSPRHYVATLTSARERSARLGAEAVRMAAAAYDTVTAEFDRVYDRDTAARLSAAYLRRLLRADLGAQLRRAIRGRDGDLSLMLDELAALVAHVPPFAVEGAADAVRSELLDPLASGWWLLDPAGRAAFARLLAVLRVADPGLIGGTPSRLRRVLYRLVARSPRLGRPVASLALAALVLVERKVLRRG